MIDDIYYDAFVRMCERPIEERPHYVYVWLYKDGEKNIPFYVGQGTGNRYKDTGTRSHDFKRFLVSHECQPAILWPHLTQWAADELEEVTKMVLKSEGYPILDGEHFDPFKSKMAMAFRMSGCLG